MDTYNFFIRNNDDLTSHNAHCQQYMAIKSNLERSLHLEPHLTSKLEIAPCPTKEKEHAQQSRSKTMHLQPHLTSKLKILHVPQRKKGMLSNHEAKHIQH